ncbi:LysE family translocator [Oceanimonas sp. AH20CE76]|uniref:LysE family translocator n=1 Tax=Oceanimonas sp. AH20CE76 TaxID=2977120 RepID=UPI0031FEE7D1
MTFSLILPMTMFALAASISPGPVNLVCLGSGLHHPLRCGLRFVTGATLGFILLFMAVGLGLYGLLQAYPPLLNMLHWGGIAFLLYISFRLATASGSLSAQGPETSPGLLTGAMMQWLNPKAWLASAAGIAAYTNGGIEQISWFALIYLPVCWCSLFCWVWLGKVLQRHLRTGHWLRWLNRLLALLLAASSLYLLRY